MRPTPPHGDQLTPMSKPFSPEATRYLAIVRGHKLKELGIPSTPVTQSVADEIAAASPDWQPVEGARRFRSWERTRWRFPACAGGSRALPVTPVRSLCEMPVQQVISDRCTHCYHTASKTKDGPHPGRRGEGQDTETN